MSVHLSLATTMADIRLPERFILGDVLPWCESQCVEFKMSFVPQLYAQRYTEIVCSFLNAHGGYLIFGVRNVDRSVQGIKMSVEQLEQFSLFVDQLNLTICPKGCVKSRVEQIVKSYYVCVIECAPNQHSLIGKVKSVEHVLQVNDPLYNSKPLNVSSEWMYLMLSFVFVCTVLYIANFVV